MDHCILCGNNEYIPLYNQTLKKCRSCGLITANMEISDAILESVYKEKYFKGDEYLNYLQDKEAIQLNFRKRIQDIRKIVAVSNPISNCLEIGCAYGFFGEVFSIAYPAAYKGIDIVPEAIEHARKKLQLDVICGDYLEQPSPEMPYSDVFLWDVIEHLAHPETFLTKIHNELKPGGRLYITTGDISALLPHIQRRKWRMIHPPSHIYYFSRAHLTRLLQQHGFRVVHVSYPAVYRSIRQIYYSLFLLKKPGCLAGKLFKLIPASWFIPLNTFDIMFVTAVKE